MIFDIWISLYNNITIFVLRILLRIRKVTNLASTLKVCGTRSLLGWYVALKRKWRKKKEGRTGNSWVHRYLDVFLVGKSSYWQLELIFTGVDQLNSHHFNTAVPPLSLIILAFSYCQIFVFSHRKIQVVTVWLYTKLFDWIFLYNSQKLFQNPR